MKKIMSFLVIVIMLMVGIKTPKAEEVCYGSVCFPDGERSFADSYISYVPDDPNVEDCCNNPSSAEGSPDYKYPEDGSYVSLGCYGLLVVKFTDNSLTTSGDSDVDLWIFEIGYAVEPTDIAISTDGSNWIEVGSTSGATSGIDIDAYTGDGVVLGERYSYVRITDRDCLTQSPPYPGADIDAVGAIESADPVTTTTTAPATSTTTMPDTSTTTTTEGSGPECCCDITCHYFLSENYVISVVNYCSDELYQLSSVCDPEAICKGIIDLTPDDRYAKYDGSCYNPDASTTTSTTIELTTTTAPADTTTTTTQESSDIITLKSGTINGQSIDPSDPQVTVATGSSLIGTVNITVTNSQDARAAVPVCVTPNWEDQGRRETIHERIDTWAPVGDTAYPVYVELTAPGVTGDCYILFGSSAEIDCGDVMSNTNWAYGAPVWDDGNDYVDFDETTIQTAIRDGWVTVSKLTSEGYVSGEVGANAVKVTVVSEITTTTTPYLIPITGTVKDGFIDPPEPIAGVVVTCGESSATTDEEGNYALNQVPGKWTIKVEDGDYVISTREITLDPSDVSFKENYEENFSLTPLVVLTGTVKDQSTGEAVKEVLINVSGDEESSDEKGEFGQKQVPGKWFIEVTAEEYDPVVKAVEVEEGDRSEEIHFSIYKSGLLGLIAGTVTDFISLNPIEWVEISTDGGGLTFSDIGGNYDLYQKPGTWTMEADADGYASHYELVTVNQGGQNIIKDIEMYPIVIATSTTTTVNPTTTTTTKITTTTTEPGGCFLLSVYGENSKESKIMRSLRDNVLLQTQEGQELIRLYYQWSPAIVKAMEEDEAFKEEVREMIDGVLGLIVETEWIS